MRKKAVGSRCEVVLGAVWIDLGLLLFAVVLYFFVACVVVFLDWW